VTHEVEGQPAKLDAHMGTWRGRLLGGTVLAAVVGLGAAGAQAALTPGSYRRFMLAYLVAFAFVLSLALGGLFFVFLQHLTRAGWSVLLRRLPEALAVNIVVVALLFMPIAASVLRGQGEIYPWAREAQGHGRTIEQTGPEGTGLKNAETGWGDAAVNHGEAVDPSYEHQHLDELTLAKRGWLNVPGFVGRWVGYFGLWTLCGWFYWRNSVRQDDTEDYRRTQTMQRVSGVVAVLFGFTLTFAAWDLLMSLNPHWYSTIFGVYYFAGAVVGSLSLLILLVLGLKRIGALPATINTEHQHDLGKLLFAFVFFWGYIAFSQYMLLWYGNIPEEIFWLRVRGMSTATGSVTEWSYFAVMMLFGNFLIPFAGLLSRGAKRRAGVLAFWAVWLLVMHWLDLVWLVMPELGPNVTIGAIEIGLTVGLSSVYLLGVWLTLGRGSLVPVHDPRISESLAFENV